MSNVQVVIRDMFDPYDDVIIVNETVWANGLKQYGVYGTGDFLKSFETVDFEAPYVVSVKKVA